MTSGPLYILLIGKIWSVNWDKLDTWGTVAKSNLYCFAFSGVPAAALEVKFHASRLHDEFDALHEEEKGIRVECAFFSEQL